MFRNTHDKYGLISKLVHWLSAFVIIGLYILGKWMEDLDYYSEWYRLAPNWHKSIGIILLLLTIFRIVWKLKVGSPAPISSHSINIKRATKIGHNLIYISLITAMCSGYLISTADGRAIEVFSWFSIPSMGELFSNQEDIAGAIHEQATNAVILLAIIHVLGALKHHFIDKDKTLIRMLK
ncbi:MAG: cytochrome b [Thalassotalea sp.]